MLAPYFGADDISCMCLARQRFAEIMCAISAGAAKGSITQHFCLRGNMADLNAKEGTQETLVSLMGMILGIILARHLHIKWSKLTCDCSRVGKLPWCQVTASSDSECSSHKRDAARIGCHHSKTRW
mmetsp:Transcript_1884/g.2930  ORF Transcript_1884/g.2930 Transcript_1884/m.2930 type:complete len:126 (+) Transcript_1884:573-950(+)